MTVPGTTGFGSVVSGPMARGTKGTGTVAPGQTATGSQEESGTEANSWSQT